MGSYGVDIQWYTQKKKGLLQYRIQNLPPVVCLTHDLIKVGFDDEMKAEYLKVRSKKDSTLWHMPQSVYDNALERSGRKLKTQDLLD